VGVTFNWDTTTQTLSNFVLTAVGPLGMGISNTPASVNFDGTALIFMSFQGPGSEFQLDYDEHAFLIPPIMSTPGTYRTDLGFFCDICGRGNSFEIGTATVTAVGPVSTPEPGTLTSLASALGLLAFVGLKQRRLA
jgi:hypothetical protein